MLANYLTTQLPAEMRVNDANHLLSVENQISRLAASLHSVAMEGAVGSVLTQSVSLGSHGEPPFAPADGASIGPGALGSKLSTSFTANGGSTYLPPTVGPAGGGGAVNRSCSAHSSTTLTCSTTTKVVWNFTSSSPGSFSITTSGGPYYVNISVSGSTIAMTASSSAPVYLVIVGNNDTLTLTISGSADVLNIEMIGSNDAVNIAAGSWTGSTVSLLFVGNYDSLSTGTQSLSNSRLTASFYGSYDSAQLGTTSATSSSVGVYFNGFVPASPSPTCPVDNLAASTDSVTTTGSQTGGTYTVTYNDTSVSSGSAPPSPWTGTYAIPTPFACPFFSTLLLPQRSSGSVGGSFLVTLRNTYAPQALVAFDQGAIVFAQPSGLPIILVGPAISYVGGTLSLWVPEFLGPIASEVGVGTAELSVHLVSDLNITLPSNGFSLSGTTSIAITTPYAAAWLSYLTASTSPLASYTVCAPATSKACTGPFSLNGPLGTVFINVTATALSMQVASYALTLA